MTETDAREILAVGPFAWGRGGTREEAVTNCRRNLRQGTHDVVLYDVPPGTAVNGLGRFVFWPPEGRTWPDTTGTDTDLSAEEFEAWKPRELDSLRVRKR